MHQPITCGPFRISENTYEPGYRQAPHCHPEAGITLVLAGGICERVARTEEFASALSVVIKPAGVRHADEIGPRGAQTLQVLYDPADEATQIPGSSLSTWRWLHAQPVTAGMLALLRAFRARASPQELNDRVIEAIASVDDGPILRSAPPPWLRRVREAAQDEPQSTFCLTELARSEDLHAVTLSRAFRRHYGCTVSEYRRNIRVRRAASAIETSDHSLSRIAHESGFADHPHLAREFRRAAGLTSSEFRELARNVKSVQAMAPGAD